MPFVRGRFYANPIAGAAIENARDAEEALRSSTNEDDESGYPQEIQSSATPARHIEIEVAELVPPHSGQTSTGYVAVLHREVSGDGKNGSSRGKADIEKRVFYDPEQLLSFLKDELSKNGSCR